jgi:hypothetical protein
MNARRSTQIERDLRRYCQQRGHDVMRDVAQAFEIAGLSLAQAGACVGATFLGIAATIAIHSQASKQSFLNACAEVYDLAAKAEQQDDSE